MATSRFSATTCGRGRGGVQFIFEPGALLASLTSRVTRAELTMGEVAQRFGWLLLVLDEIVLRSRNAVKHQLPFFCQADRVTFPAESCGNYRVGSFQVVSPKVEKDRRGLAGAKHG
jgi:hypothetical protein